MPQAHSVDNETEGVKLLFKEFDPRTAKKLVESGIEASFEPGQFIFKENDQPSQFYLITRGSVALEQPGPPHAIRIQTLHEGHFLGWSAILDSGTRQFQARALTPVTVLTFDGSFLRRACDEDPQFGYALMKRLLTVITERLDATRMQVVALQRGEMRTWAAGSSGTSYRR
jgi:CRP/FNR family cyclic AMP-dependent transcriptional regulator